MATYQGKNVELNKPRRIRKGEPGYGRKQSVVFVNDKGKTRRVMFGDPNMKIKKHVKGNKKNFDSRFNCDNPGPRTGARYWSCEAWK